MTCLGTPCPSARMLKQNAFVRDPVHLWMAIGRMILTYPLPELAILGDICKINGLFTLCPHLSHLCSIQESGIQTPQDGYFERLVCHFSISKLSEYSHIPCLNTSSLGFIILCVASRVSFNNGVAVFLLMHYSDTDSFPASLFYFLGPFWLHWGHLDNPWQSWASLVAQMVKNIPAIQETQVQSFGWGDPLEKGMTIHPSILAWRILWTEEPGRLQSMGSQRAEHNWATNTFTLIE